ncbi:MAG: hypothetical protein COA42_06965, partial [Alteromonadaceae bacterium]
MLNQAAEEHKADALEDSPLQETNDDDGDEANLVAALLDENCFYFIFDQLFDPDLPPAQEDLLIKSNGQSYNILDSQLLSPIKEGSSWSALAILVDKVSPGQVAVSLRYNPSQWFIWSLTHADSVGAFNINTQLLSNQPLKEELSFLKAEFDAEALNQAQASSNTEKHQAKAFINLAVGRHIQITFDGELDMACPPNINDFRAESDNHWLTINTVNLVKPNIGWPDLRIELAEELQEGDKISVGYRSPNSKLKTVNGKAVENFTISEIASALSGSDSGIPDQAHAASESPQTRISISNAQDLPQVSTSEAISATDQGIADMLGLRLVQTAKAPPKITEDVKPAVEAESTSTSTDHTSKQDLEISLDVTFIESDAEPNIKSEPESDIQQVHEELSAAEQVSNTDAAELDSSNSFADIDEQLSEPETTTQQDDSPTTDLERDALADTAQHRALSEDDIQHHLSQDSVDANVTPDTRLDVQTEETEDKTDPAVDETVAEAIDSIETDKQYSGDIQEHTAATSEISEANQSENSTTSITTSKVY